MNQETHLEDEKNKVAHIKGISLDELSHHTIANTNNVLGI